MKESTNRALLSNIAHEYYEEGKTQAEIAKLYSISRPQISRKLEEARRKGIVKIFIDRDEEDINDLTQNLQSHFKLKGLKIASVPHENDELTVRITAKVGADYLHEFIEPYDRIGFGWGWTIYEMVKQFPKMHFPVDLMCQLVGSIDNTKIHCYSNDILSLLSRKLNAKNSYNFPFPVMVNNANIARYIKKDDKFIETMERGKSCNKVFLNINLPDEDCCLFKSNYLNKKDLNQLADLHSVGSVCCRFINEDGCISSPDINERTLGIELEDLKNVDLKLACITGAVKADILKTTLDHKLIDVLVIDSLLARELNRLI